MITINGKPLQQYLKVGQFSDVERSRDSIIRERKRLIHIPAGSIEQGYDTKPTYTKLYSKWEIWKMNLEEDHKRLREQIKQELDNKNPNKSKLIAGALALGEWKTVTELGETINQMAGRKIFEPKTLSTQFVGLKKDKPIRKLLQASDIKPTRYMLVPSAAKLQLADLYQLTLKNGSYTIHDAILKHPEIEIEMKQTPEQPSVPIKEAVVQTPPSIVPSVNGDVRVSINVSFGPIRILFGLDK